MGKVTLGGLRKLDDPMHKQQLIVIGGLRGQKRSKASDEKSPSRKAEEPGVKKEE